MKPFRRVACHTNIPLGMAKAIEAKASVFRRWPIVWAYSHCTNCLFGRTVMISIGNLVEFQYFIY